ncbi:hypothetical protein A4X09_0g4655 [Tilletia walkeri]|uniref:Uncharacterized protein n=1 Tax=Tilletia walkeri TaxID=117179 RepID=A0A8X7N5S9_9BASI|nr:hypothetical protein A4X09_0g4655 [Tilletia walkeri]
MLVWICLDTRPVRAARTEKLDPFRLGPLSIRRVLSPHHVLADVPPELNIESELGTSIPRVPTPSHPSATLQIRQNIQMLTPGRNAHFRIQHRL